MRVTRDSLLRIAKETAQERAFNDTDIVAVYLTGSLLNVDPMLGGTADIDIVFVHKTPPTQPREFVKLTPDFHLDISRREKAMFKSPRELRGDPWLGFEMYDPILLYEREKFFDFVQASLRAGFEFEQPRKFNNPSPKFRTKGGIKCNAMPKSACARASNLNSPRSCSSAAAKCSRTDGRSGLT